ncbi:glycerophosphodiester phosphodiesterase [Thermococcus sp. P6]|nr:glycerophosphodiester phosphodiesterase [Thermococcus sp. P6]
MYREGPVILGHRGFRGRIENTLPAFRRALKYADGIEFDVRLTGDGKVLVHHDDSFVADGFSHSLRDLSLVELRRLHPMGRLVPTLGEVVREFKGVRMDVDVKEIETVEETLRLVERYNALEKAVFSSEDPEIVRTVLRECPECRVGFSIVGYSSVPRLLRLKGIHSVHVPIDAVSYIGYRPLMTILRALRRRGLAVYLWNYRMDEMFWVPRLISVTDVLISDDPARLRKSFLPQGATE